MGLFDLFKKPPETDSPSGYWTTLSGYSPVFSTYNGNLYEQLLTRAAINQIATQFSKLTPELSGIDDTRITSILGKPSKYQTRSQFLYRLATVLLVDTTAVVLPLSDRFGVTTGLICPKPYAIEAVDVRGALWLKVDYSGGDLLVPYDAAGVMTLYQMGSDLYGGGNSPLDDTMSLIQAQSDGVVNRIKNSAVIQWMGKVAGQIAPADLDRKRKKFASDNLSTNNDTNLLVYDNTFIDMKQVEYRGWSVDAEQLEQINQNVYSYFGVNRDILQNSYNEDTWGAFYEGRIEPLAIQASEVLSSMLLEDSQRAAGGAVMLTSSALQYASNATKLAVSQGMVDRGLMTGNQVMDIWNLPHYDGGDTRIIRGEYIAAENIAENTVANAKALIGAKNNAD